MHDLKFEGQGQLFDILNQFNIDKTLFIQFGLFVILYFICKKFIFEKYSEVLFKRFEGTSLAVNKISSLQTEILKLDDQYNSAVKAQQIAINDEFRNFSNGLKKDYDEKIHELKNRLEKDLKAKQKTYDEQTKDKIEEAIPKVIELKEKIVGKLLG